MSNNFDFNDGKPLPGPVPPTPAPPGKPPTTGEDRPAPWSFPVLKCPQLEEGVVQFRLDYKSLPGDPTPANTQVVNFVPGATIGASDNPDDVVELYIKHRFQSPGNIKLLGSLTDNNLIQFQVDNKVSCVAGIYLATITLRNSTDPSRNISGNCFFEVEPNTLFESGQVGPLSISELRLVLRDEVPEQNFLLDDLDFTDKEVAKAIVDAVEEWNETPPNIISYTPSSFPWRRYWCKGALGLLLTRKSRWMLRNHLPTQGGGISMDDMGKWRDYIAVGEAMLQEWRDFVTRKKLEANLASGYGYTS